jgi:hypothetical protein
MLRPYALLSGFDGRVVKGMDDSGWLSFLVPTNVPSNQLKIHTVRCELWKA